MLLEMTYVNVYTAQLLNKLFAFLKEKYDVKFAVKDIPFSVKRLNFNVTATT